mgnify:CR=1 FL=1
MIVKDEIGGLERCIDSVAGLVDEIAVVDTGSTDGTWPLVQTLSHRHQQIEWPNHFGQARNAALDLASEDWVLVLDGDEVLVSGHENIRTAIQEDGLLAAEVQILNALGDGKVGAFWALRLFRRHPDIRWEGRIHEQVLPSIQAVMARESHWRFRRVDARIDHDGYLPEVMDAKQKGPRNVGLLKQELAELPDSAPMSKRAYIEYKLSAELGPSGQPHLAQAANRVMQAGPEERRRFGLAAEVLLSASQQWCRAGSPEQALKAADMAADIHADNAMVALAQAQSHLALRNVDKAEEAAGRSRGFEDAHSAFHFDRVAHDVALSIVEATIASRRGRGDLQMTIMDGLCQRQVDHKGAQLARLRVLVEQGLAKEALFGGVEHLKKHGASVGALLLCADAAQALGMTDKAEKWRSMAEGR